MRHRIFNIILLILVAFTASSQINNSATYRVATNLTDFGKNVPAGTVVIDMANNKTFLLITAATSTQDLTDLVEGTNKIELGIASDINWSLSGSDLENLNSGKVIIDSDAEDNTQGIVFKNTADTEIGHLFYAGSNNMQFDVSSGTWTLSAVSFYNQTAGAGKIGTPALLSYAFYTDNNSGIQWLAADNFVIQTGGISSMEFTETASAVDIEVFGTMSFGTNSLGYDAVNPGISFDAVGSVNFPDYGSGTNTGTATKWLAVDASGNLIEEDAPAGGTPQNLSYNTGTHAIDIDQGGTSATIPLAAADGSTLGLSAFLSAEFSASSGIISLLSDGIDETHLDWGTGAGQISAVDILIADGGGIITATEVESALQENRTAIDLNTSKVGVDTDVVNDLHIDWGTGTNQVATADIPEQTNLYYTEARVSANTDVTANTSARHTQNTDSDTKPDASLDADHTADGMIMTFTAGTGGFSYGQVGYVSASQTLTIADADATTTAPVVGICIESAGITAASTGSFLINGVVRDDTWNWTIGGEIYLDVTAGALTQTAPSATGDIVQIVGIAITADIMLFNPQLAYGVLK